MEEKQNLKENKRIDKSIKPSVFYKNYPGGKMMRKTRKPLLMILLTLMMVSVFMAGCGSGNKAGSSSDNSSKTVKIKIAHVGTEDTTLHTKYVKFKEVVEAESDGKFEVEIFPNSQLGGEREITESTQINNVQISSPAIGHLATMTPALQVFNLPFLFKDSEQAYEVLDGPIGQELLEDLDENGFIGLGYAENGWRHLTTKKEPVTKPDQVQGIKLRTMEDPLHLAFWKEIGLNPTPLAFSEVFTALSQGVVDGQENPLSLIHSMKFHEVNPYITLTGHIYDPEVFIVNKTFFESLSEEDQELIERAAKESIEFQREQNKIDEDEFKKKLQEEGATITELTDKEKEAWVNAVKNIYKEYKDDIGEETLKKVLEATDNTVGLEAIK